MTKSKLRAARACLVLCASIAGFVVGNRSLLAQSPVVFMTADLTGFNSKLVRFDAGVETYAVSNSGAIFEGVTGLNGNVLVADYGNDQIQKFSPSGTYLGIFATPSFSPVFLESDSAGNVYTTPDGIGGPVAARIDSSGVVNQLYTGSGTLLGVDADSSGNVYVAQKSGGPGSGALLKFSSGGTLLNTTLLGSMDPWDVAIDEVGKRLFLADDASSTLGIKVFDISGAAPILTGSIVTPASSFIFGVHYAAESGNVLAVDSGDFSNDPRGLEFSPAGALIAQYRPANIIHGQDITTFVPEPSSVMLLLIGTLGLGWKRGRFM